MEIESDLSSQPRRSKADLAKLRAKYLERSKELMEVNGWRRNNFSSQEEGKRTYPTSRSVASALSVPSWPKRDCGDGMESFPTSSTSEMADRKTFDYRVPNGHVYVQPLSTARTKTVMAPQGHSQNLSAQRPMLTFSSQQMQHYVPVQNGHHGLSSSEDVSHTVASHVLTEQPLPRSTDQTYHLQPPTSSMGNRPPTRSAGEATSVSFRESSLAASQPSSVSSAAAANLQETQEQSQELRGGPAGCIRDLERHSISGKCKNKRQGQDNDKLELEHLRGLNDVTIPQPSSAELQLVVKERDDAKRQLQIQIKRNAELKRLLVASVGDDLQQKFDALCREKAEFSQEATEHQEQLQLQSERVEHLAIQCDVYQSKYRASCVMIEELSSLQSQLQSRYTSCCAATEQLLAEQKQIFSLLASAHQQLCLACHALCLHQGSGNAPPIDASHSSSRASSFSLAQHIGQLSRWLSTHLRVPVAASKSLFSIYSMKEVKWQPTAGEKVARQVIHGAGINSEPLSPASHRISSAARRTSSGLFSMWTTINYTSYPCCSHCVGEVQVI